MASSFKSAVFLIESRMAEAANGDGDACYELGMVYSSGSGGVDIDLVQAHKWFNLAALAGNSRGHESRAEIAWDMTAREIAEAQRQARDWIGSTQRRAA